MFRRLSLSSRLVCCRRTFLSASSVSPESLAADRVKSAVRRLLLRTHPDFFEGLPEQQTANAQSLALMNMLSAAARGEGSAPPRLPSVLRFTLHSRTASPSDAPLHLEIDTPPPHTTDADEMRRFCASALHRLLVAAGEALPEDSPERHELRKQQAQWYVIPNVDIEGLKQEMYTQSFSLEPAMHPSSRRAPATATTPRQWDEKVVTRRGRYWLSRTLLHPRVSTFDGDDAMFAMMQIAQSDRELLATVYDLPVYIVPEDWTAEAAIAASEDVPVGCVVLRAGLSKEQIVEALKQMAESVRSERRAMRRAIDLMLRTCDVVCAKGSLVGLKLSDEMMKDPVGTTSLLLELSEAPHFLEKCVGTVVSLRYGADQAEDHVARVVEDLVTLDDVHQVVPSVEVLVARGLESSVSFSQLFEDLRFVYCLNHARKRAAVAQKVLEVQMRFQHALKAFRLGEKFQKLSLTRQCSELERLDRFLSDLGLAEATSHRLGVVFGAPKISFKNSTLTLPVSFEHEDIAKILNKRKD